MTDTRNTIQKKIIKTVVMSMKNHPCADMIYEKIRKEYQSISKATVYRVLNAMADHGEILRVKLMDGPDIYDFNNIDHYHVKCIKCGKVDDVVLNEPDNLENLISDSSGYTIQRHRVLFEGICPECATVNTVTENETI